MLSRLLFLACFFIVCPRQMPAQAANPIDLSNNAAAVVRSFLQDSNAVQVRNLARQSKAVFIVPSYYKAGFIVGGSGGVGVLIAKDPRSGQWGYPAFANIGGISVGLQVGGSASELLIFIMTDRGLESIVNNQIRLGGSAGLAFATWGAEVSGSKGLTSWADFVTIARSVGVYGGLNLEGAAIEQRTDMARNFYGQPASFYPILILQQYSSPVAQPLRDALQMASTPGAGGMPLSPGQQGVEVPNRPY
jgi:SH3 domain-containing YSC84-like protein 1